MGGGSRKICNILLIACGPWPFGNRQKGSVMEGDLEHFLWSREVLKEDMHMQREKDAAEMFMIHIKLSNVTYTCFCCQQLTVEI